MIHCDGAPPSASVFAERGISRGQATMEVLSFRPCRMQSLTYAQARLAAFLFFSASGLAYGLFTARIPSLKEQTGAASDELGLVLFALGAASVIGLSGARTLCGALA